MGRCEWDASMPILLANPLCGGRCGVPGACYAAYWWCLCCILLWRCCSHAARPLLPGDRRCWCYAFNPVNAYGGGRWVNERNGEGRRGRVVYREHILVSYTAVRTGDRRTFSVNAATGRVGTGEKNSDRRAPRVYSCTSTRVPCRADYSLDLYGPY